MARSEGAEVSDLGIARDRIEDIAAAVRRARDWGADILLTSGGASVGEHDLVQRALAAEGLDAVVLAGGAAPRPADDAWPAGRHAGAGRAGQSGVVLCLRLPVPGAADPAALPAASDIERVPEPARLGRDLPANDERADYLRATLIPGPDGPVATPLPAQDSSLMAPLAKADCLLIRRAQRAGGGGRFTLRHP